MDRREFLGWLGAASGVSLLAGCDLTRKSEKLIPYLVPPDDGVIPGEATFVSSTCGECPAGCAITARIRDDRPVKVDGLAGHPVNDGALCVRGQASLNRLYNVDRIRQPLMQDGAGHLVPGTWNQVLARTSQALKANGNHLLLSGRTSGSLNALLGDFSQRAGVERLPEFELFSYAAIREANRSLFGSAIVPTLHSDRADVIITVGADVLETFGNPVAFTGGLSRRHNRGEHVNWYHVEPHASLTGYKATHRVVVKPGSEAFLLAYLLHAVAGTRAGSVPAVDAVRAAQATGIAPATLEEMARALGSAHAPMVVAGGVSTAQESGADVARLAALLQSALGMHGRTVDIARVTDYSRVGSLVDMEAFAVRLDAGQVGTVILFDVDPVSQLPSEMKVAQRLDQAAFLVGIGDMMTPTLERCDVVLPLSHELESWGDAEPVAGVLNVVQPAFKPLFDTLSAGDILLRILAEMGSAAPTTYQQYVADRWSREHGPAAAEQLIKSGFIVQNMAEGVASLRASDHKYTFDSLAPKSGATVVVAPSLRWYDGRSRALDLLNEVPDPLAAVSWGDWVSVGLETASALGVKDHDEIELRAGEWSRHLSVRRQPGLARDVFVIQRGIDAPPARWSRGVGEVNAVIAGVSVSRTGSRNKIGILSGSLTEEGRGIVPGSHPKHFGALKRQLEAHGDHHEPRHEDISFYPLPKYPTYRWAMAIDMEKCVGCSACVAACYVENNVPMTGPSEHVRGREMSWIRIEPYYSEDGSTLDTVPAMCQHCDYAPCEPVCPVYATYHTDEGLNAQVYNRCVGTRYCSNNCPYKQRRFNFFPHQHRPHPLNLMTNPDVSLRGKGIMEKCTFCVQRVRKARDLAKDEGRTIAEGEVTTACAQACPGKAIVFGNLLDTNSEVYKWAHHERSTRMLEELGTAPGVYYLKKGNRHA